MKFPPEVVRRRSLIALALFVAVALLLVVQQCQAFTPYPADRRANNGAILIEWTEANGPINCPAAAWNAGYHVMAVLGSGILFVFIECAIVQPRRCHIVSAGMTDYELGHEGRHCFDGDYHPFALPFVDLE